jgi:hypothetical protein
MNLLQRFAGARRAHAAVSVGWLLAVGAWAQNIPPGYPPRVDGYDRREVAMLPRYCLFTQGFRIGKVPGSEDQVTTDRWYEYLGPTFHALHHYCWGMMKTNRALLLARDTTTREFYLQDSIAEFDFVIERAPDNFLLLPEILTKRGENLVRLNKGAIGVLDLERAIALKEDYWPAYAELSDYYKGTGNVAKAREALQRGLEKSPDAAALKRRLQEIDSPPRKAAVTKK